MNEEWGFVFEKDTHKPFPGPSSPAWEAPYFPFLATVRSLIRPRDSSSPPLGGKSCKWVQGESGEKQLCSREDELVHLRHTARSQGPTAAQWVLGLGNGAQPEAIACILPANLQFPSFTGCDPLASDAHRAHRSRVHGPQTRSAISLKRGALQGLCQGLCLTGIQARNMEHVEQASNRAEEGAVRQRRTALAWSGASVQGPFKQRPSVGVAVSQDREERGRRRIPRPRKLSVGRS